MAKKIIQSNSYGEAPTTLVDHPFYGLQLDEEQKSFRDVIWSSDKLIVFCNARAGTGKTTIAAATANLLVQYGKYDGIVYKRRTRINYSLNINNLNNLNNVSFIKTNITNKQIISEIEYFTNLYKNLKPSVFLSYDRVAYISNNDENLRITFDSNIIYRDYDLTFKSTIYGKEILPHNMVLLEIKTASNYPLWLTNFLSKEKIYQTSFSKYGKAYMSIIKLPENYEHIW